MPPVCAPWEDLDCLKKKKKKYFTMVLQGDLHDCWGELTNVNITEKSQAVGYQLLSEMGDATSVFMDFSAFPLLCSF